MLYIRWKEANKTGIDIIDEQHRGIVSAINSYYYVVQTGQPKAALELTKGMLNEMTELHFRTEEELLKRAGYPQYQSHAAMHLKLMSTMNDVYQQSILESDYNLFLQFLRNWWLHHINNEDMKYVNHLSKSES